MLKPMSGVGKGEELGVRAVAQTFLRHFSQEEGVAFAPKDAGGHTNGFIWKLDASAEERAVPADHAGEGSGLRPCSAVLDEGFIRERSRAAGAQKGPRAAAQIEVGEKGLRKPGRLEAKREPITETRQRR